MTNSGITSKFKSDNIYQQNHIDVLDGVRAVTIMIIVWFHFWQQSWIMPRIGRYSLDWIPRSGALWVDMMILLSGFCLFLPYAKEMVYGRHTVSAKEFYIKRAARIMPSYYLCIIICLFVFALPFREYNSSNFMLKDIFTHIFFINNLWSDTLMATRLNGALWTVAVEMQFYLFFPFIAKFFQKKPLLCYTVMCLAGALSCLAIGMFASEGDFRFYVNYTPTYLTAFANGMAGALVYVKLAKKLKKNIFTDILFSVMAVGGLYFFKTMCDSHTAYGNTFMWQVKNRVYLAYIYLFILFSILIAQRIFTPLLGNKLMKFISGISYNLYIWHQFISVKLKEFRIPYWQGDTPPNMTGDKVWMWKYFILCVVVSTAVAVIITYFVEKPAAKAIMNRFSNRHSSQTNQTTQEKKWKILL